MQVDCLRYIFVARAHLILSIVIAMEGMRWAFSLLANPMEKSISIVIMLFTLSLISERLVTWVKLEWGRRGKKLPGFSTAGEDWSKKSNDEQTEKIREKQILGLNIVLSTVIAVAANADFLQILRASNPYEAIGWGCPQWTSLIGWPLTGLFISLGSKFWHDLLDLLLYTKNLKQKLSDPQTYEVTSVDQLEEFLKFTETDLIQLAIAQNEQALRIKFPGIRDLNDSVKIINNERRKVLTVYFKDNSTKGFPTTIPVLLPSGKKYHVLTEIIPGAGIVTHSAGLDAALRHENLNYQGSACCVVTAQEENFLLTNCHVLTDGRVQNPLSNTGDFKVFYDEQEIGTWTFGSMTSVGDFALVKLNESNRDTFVSDYHPQLFNNRKRDVFKDDCLVLQVNTTGSKSKNNTGYVVDIFIDKLTVDYRGNMLTFHEAILVADRQDKENCLPITATGDSGGLLCDASGNLIGVITAIDNRFTYVIPIKKFLEVSPDPKIKIL